MRFEIKLFLVFVLFSLAVAGVVWFLNLRAEKELVARLQNNLNDIVRTVHLSSQKLSSAQGTDRLALENFIRELKAKKGVREVSVVGSSQEVIASSNPKKLGQRRELTGQEIVVKEQFGVRDSSGHFTHYEVKVPLLREGRIIGLVQISIFLDDFRYLLRQIHLKNFVILLVALVFAFGASFFVLHRLNQPLRRLTGAAERVAAGDLSFRLQEKGKDEIQKLTAAFNTMTNQLAEQRQMEEKLRILEKQEILTETASTLAHEIRNPLNLINLTADHLSHQFQPEDLPRKKSYGELISGLKAQVAHLNKMVEDFLALGRSAKLKKTKFAVRDLFVQVETLVKRQLLAKRVALKAEGDLNTTLFADPEQLRLVLLNLVLNAIEAVPESGIISIKTGKISPSQLSLAVQDNGGGIAAQDLERVFEPYFSRRPGGTGLGLALAKRIVEEHNGSIRAVNGTAGGACIEIKLPMEG